MAAGPVVLRLLLFIVLMVVFSATLGTLAALGGLITSSSDLTKSLFWLSIET